MQDPRAFNDVREMSVGKGAISFHADSQGIWLGRETYAEAITASFAVSMTGQLYATGATISGAITATSGVIGGFTIGATTITGSGSGGDILTAATGERFEIKSSTKRINLISAAGNTVSAWFINPAGGGAIFDIELNYANAGNRGIFINTGSSNTGSPIYINNAGTGIGLRVVHTNTASIGFDVASNSNDEGGAVFIQGLGTRSGVYIEGQPSTTLSGVLKVATLSGSTRPAIFAVSNNSNAQGYGIEVDRDGNTTGNTVGIYVDTQNSGTGEGIGIQVNSKTHAFYASSSTPVALYAVGVSYVLKTSADATALGAYSGRIPIQVGANTRYIPYYV